MGGQGLGKRGAAEEEAWGGQGLGKRGAAEEGDRGAVRRMDGGAGKGRGAERFHRKGLSIRGNRLR